MIIDPLPALLVAEGPRNLNFVQTGLRTLPLASLGYISRDLESVQTE
jgi:hypothetical protein